MEELWVIPQGNLLHNKCFALLLKVLLIQGTQSVLKAIVKPGDTFEKVTSLFPHFTTEENEAQKHVASYPD